MKRYIKLWFQLPLWKRIIVALILGVVAGITMGKEAVIFKPFGMIFIHAIHMMVVPVVFTAIVCAVISMAKAQKMHAIWIKALIIYLISMLIASCLGLAIAVLTEPGSGINISTLHLKETQSVQHLSFVQQLVNIVPSNPVQAFASGNILQILVFALILGFAINLSGKSGEPIAKLFKSFSHVVFKFASIIMEFAPYGIFALLSWVLGEFGIAVLLPLLKFVAVVYGSCLVLIFCYYCPVLKVLVRMNPGHFLKAILPSIIMAYSTSSSAATLPTSLRVARDNLKLNKNIAGFLLPLGASLNLNGLTIYIVTATIFSANLFGIHLHMAQYITIVLTTILAAMGAAAVPGSALIVMGVAMSSVGIPLTGISLIAGVDRLNDMAQTTTNVMGDLFATTLVAKSTEDDEVTTISE